MESTSLVKGLGLLEATALDPNGRLLAALAAEVGLSKPTAHRILKTLTKLGYLERAPGGIYRQSRKVQRLVCNGAIQDLLAVAEPHLKQLHERTLETVNLGVLRSDRVIYLRVLESPQPLRRVATPNSVDPFHSTALGRAIAARLAPEERESLLELAQLETNTPRTRADRKSLMAILDQVAREGYAVEVDETDVGVTCIGAAILEADVPVAAVSISVPTARAAGKQLRLLVAAVCTTVDEIAASFQTRNSIDAPKAKKRPRKRVRL